MARFVYRVFVWGTDGLQERKDTELTLGEFLAKSREVYMLRARKFDIGLTCQNFSF